MEFSPVTSQFWLEVGISLLCGSIIGIEREIRSKPTGMRTCVLICMGTALFVKMGSVAANDQTDSTRVIGQVVTGIGFLGGGVILARGEIVTGVTTASVVWLLAAIGTMIGVGEFSGEVAVTVVAVVILVGYESAENAIASLRQVAPQESRNCHRIRRTDQEPGGAVLQCCRFPRARPDRPETIAAATTTTSENTLRPLQYRLSGSFHRVPDAQVSLPRKSKYREFSLPNLHRARRAPPVVRRRESA